MRYWATSIGIALVDCRGPEHANRFANHSCGHTRHNSGFQRVMKLLIGIKLNRPSIRIRNNGHVTPRCLFSGSQDAASGSIKSFHDCVNAPHGET